MMFPNLPLARHTRRDLRSVLSRATCEYAEDEVGREGSAATVNSSARARYHSVRPLSSAAARVEAARKYTRAAPRPE